MYLFLSYINFKNDKFFLNLSSICIFKFHGKLKEETLFT